MWHELHDVETPNFFYTQEYHHHRPLLVAVVTTTTAIIPTSIPCFLFSLFFVRS